MIVRLTEGQYRACQEVARGWPELGHDLERGMTERIGALNDMRPALGRDVQMPYIAFVALRDRLTDRAFNSFGFRQKGVSTRIANALKRVAGGCNTWARLPPLTGAGMLGWQPLIIPVWFVPPGITAEMPGWLPYPVDGRSKHLLRPRWITQNGTKLTAWSAEDVPAANDHWSLGDEAFRPYVDVARRELDLALFVQPS